MADSATDLIVALSERITSPRRLASNIGYLMTAGVFDLEAATNWVVTNATWAANTVTITTSVPHDIVVGDTIEVVQIVSTGATTDGYNTNVDVPGHASKVTGVPASNQLEFTLELGSSPGTYSSGGIVLWLDRNYIPARHDLFTYASEIGTQSPTGLNPTCYLNYLKNTWSCVLYNQHVNRSHIPLVTNPPANPLLILITPLHAVTAHHQPYAGTVPGSGNTPTVWKNHNTGATYTRYVNTTNFPHEFLGNDVKLYRLTNQASPGDVLTPLPLGEIQPCLLPVADSVLMKKNYNGGEFIHLDQDLRVSSGRTSPLQFGRDWDYRGLNMMLTGIRPLAGRGGLFGHIPSVISDYNVGTFLADGGNTGHPYFIQSRNRLILMGMGPLFQMPTNVRAALDAAVNADIATLGLPDSYKIQWVQPPRFTGRSHSGATGSTRWRGSLRKPF